MAIGTPLTGEDYANIANEHNTRFEGLVSQVGDKLVARAKAHKNPVVKAPYIMEHRSAAAIGKCN
jgi:hypothetical protein